MRPPSWSSRPVAGASVRRLARTFCGALLVVLVAGGCTAGDRSGAPPPSAPDLAFSARLPAADVLHAWDAARATAFAEGDVAALCRLYVAGSAAGTADERLLVGYSRRGLRVEGMRMQVLAVKVRHQDSTHLRLRVTDRLTGAVAVAAGGRRTPLPRDNASTRLVELVRSAPGAPWKVRSVRE